MARSHWSSVFFCVLFLVIASIIGLRLSDVRIPALLIVVLAFIMGIFALWVFVQNLLSTREALQKSAHPDSDVAALIEEHIDIGEYRRSKEASDV